MDVTNAKELVDIIKSIITPHDLFQDAVLSFLSFAVAADMTVNILHLLWHRKRGDFYTFRS